MSESVFNRVKELIVAQLGVKPETIAPNANFKADLKVDSLDLVELVMVAEETFGINVPDDDLKSILTVQDMVDYLVKRGVS